MTRLPEREKDIEQREEVDILSFFAHQQNLGVETGPEWFIPQLEHLLPDKAAGEGDRHCCQLRARDKNVEDVPLARPLRAMFSVFKSFVDNIAAKEKETGAPDSGKRFIRVWACSLSCPFVLDLLVHCAKHFQIQVILHPKFHSAKMMKVCVDSPPRGADVGSPR